MRVRPPGSLAVLPSGEILGQRTYLLVFVDPDKAADPGYRGTELTPPLRADEMRKVLRGRGHAEADIDQLLLRASRTAMPIPERASR